MYIGNPLIQSAFLVDTFSGNNSTTVFTMSVAPANTASVLVAVSGVLQDPSTYAVVGTTLTFTQAPPTGTGNISARYLGIPASGVTTTAYRTVTTFTATASQTTFTPPSYTVGFINVYRNGVLLTPTSDYTASNGTTVVLASGAASGDTVIVESFLVSSVLNAIPATAGSVGTTYLASGSVTQPILGTNVAGNGPAFSAYANSNVNISSTVWTKVTLNTKEFDTNSNFDASTNYRFTPTVAGYYFIYGQANLNNSAGSSPLQGRTGIYKNGSLAREGFFYTVGNTGVFITSVSSLIYFNGTTDYVELWAYINCSGTPAIYGNQNDTFMTGYLARSA